MLPAESEELLALRRLHTSCGPCVTASCRRGQCVLQFGPHRALCIDCDQCYSFPSVEGVKKPDYILLVSSGSRAESSWLVVDFKGRVSSVGKIVEQLQAGVDVINADHRFRLPTSVTALIPLIVHEGHVRADDLVRRYVKYQGRSRGLVLRRCGSSIESIIRNPGA